jgi:superfamily II DNA or RNA helicase
MTDNNYAEKGAYGTVIADEFAEELRAAMNLTIPDTFSCLPLGFSNSDLHLMQKQFAADVAKKRRYCNWSGTGAGKTISAVLSAAVVDARNVVVVCPNATIDGWANTINKTMSDHANVLFKENIKAGQFARTSEGITNFYVLNIEFFQQARSEEWLVALTDTVGPDMVVLDEIHQAKYSGGDETKRRQMLETFISECSRLHDDMVVLGMSATPVINNLTEARSLIELVTGVKREDLNTSATVNNAISMHREVAMLGSRWMPDYKIATNDITIDVPIDDATALEIRDLPKFGIYQQTHPAHIERVLTRHRIPEIIKYIDEHRSEDGSVEPTLVYTDSSCEVETSVRELYEACRERGFKASFYTGEDKSGLDKFRDRKVDVLIASSPISTGVDGLQHVCQRLIINALPWTSAAYEQLLGRLVRQGSKFDKVDVVWVKTEWDSGKDEEDSLWSWCDSKMNKIRFKRTLADTVVDGAIPEAQSITQAAATKHAMGWLERLAGEGMVEEERELIEREFDRDFEEMEPAHRAMTEFSRLNNTWGNSYTRTNHERLQADRSQWEEYHSLYRDARESWLVVPAYEIADRINVHTRGKAIADLGCGEKLLSEKLDAHHVVSSFDHVAFDDTVTACDITDLPVEDGSFDIAVMSLAIMGRNKEDYFAEASRILDADGVLYVAETGSLLEDPFECEELLGKFGLEVRDREFLGGKFWFVKATKTA